jgi:hypothetical protein
MSRSNWSKEREATLHTLFTKLIILETSIRSARNQKIALDFCFSVTQNHTYLSNDEPRIRSHFRGIVEKLEVQGQHVKAECLSSALDELYLHPVAADRAAGGDLSKYGPVTSQVLAVLRCLEGDVSSLDWKGSMSRMQQQEDGLLLQLVLQDFAGSDDSSSECSEQTSDLSLWGEESEQILPPPRLDDSGVGTPACAEASPPAFCLGFEQEAVPIAPLQLQRLGHHWQLQRQPQEKTVDVSTFSVAHACLAERCASGAYSSTMIVGESTVVCETLLMLAGLPSRIFSYNGSTVEVSTDIAVASVSPSACKSWLESWAHVGSMCRRCVAAAEADYEVQSPVVQVRACAHLFQSYLTNSSGICCLFARSLVPLHLLFAAYTGACPTRRFHANAAS